MTYEFATLPVQTYRVYDAWEKETLLETRAFEEADAARTEWQQKRQHNEIELLAVVGAQRLVR